MFRKKKMETNFREAEEEVEARMKIENLDVLMINIKQLLIKKMNLS